MRRFARPSLTTQQVCLDKSISQFQVCAKHAPLLFSRSIRSTRKRKSTTGSAKSGRSAIESLQSLASSGPSSSEPVPSKSAPSARVKESVSSELGNVKQEPLRSQGSSRASTRASPTDALPSLAHKDSQSPTQTISTPNIVSGNHGIPQALAPVLETKLPRVPELTPEQTSSLPARLSLLISANSQPIESAMDPDYSTNVYNPSNRTHRSLHLYTDNIQPSSAAIKYANKIFHNNASHLFSTHSSSFFPPTSIVPEIVLLGRSNVGKSSLINALCGVSSPKARLASTSKRAGHTKCLHVYGVAGVTGGIRSTLAPGLSAALLERDKKGRIIGTSKTVSRLGHIAGSGFTIVDTPGYGAGSHSEWGEQLQTYLTTRKQLRRAFLLLDATLSPKESDLDVLALLAQSSVPYQLILTKIDKILYPKGEAQPGPEEHAALTDLHARCLAIRKMVEDGVHERLGGTMTNKEGPMTVKERKSGNRIEKIPVQDVLCTSTSVRAPKLGDPGIAETRWAILQACGLDVLGRQKQDFLDGIPILDDEISLAATTPAIKLRDVAEARL